MLKEILDYGNWNMKIKENVQNVIAFEKLRGESEISEPQASTNITNPKEGIEYCNKQLRICEELEQKCLDKGDIATAAKYGGWKVKWAELLQHYLRQDWQMGGLSSDASKGISYHSERTRRKQRFK